MGYLGNIREINGFLEDAWEFWGGGDNKEDQCTKESAKYKACRFYIEASSNSNSLLHWEALAAVARS